MPIGIYGLGLIGAGIFGIASGSGQAWIVPGFWIGVAIAWVWLSIVSARLMTEPQV